MNEPAASTGEVSQSPGSPLAPSALKQLFFSPSAYFRSASLDYGAAWLFVAWIIGASSVMERVDQRMLREDMGGSSSGMGAIEESWFAFWALALSAGLVWAVWSWWVGGWWYRVRLRWSGASGTDPRRARLVYIFASFVMHAPAVLYTATQSIIYPNYRAAWAANSSWALLILVFLFWSVVVSWRAVLVSFPVRPTRALWWFLILPVTVYSIVLGVLGSMLAVADGS